MELRKAYLEQNKADLRRIQVDLLSAWEDNDFPRVARLQRQRGELIALVARQYEDLGQSLVELCC